MTKPLPFTQAGLQRAIAAARKAGLRVTGIRSDGTLLVDGGDKSPGIVPATDDQQQDGRPSEQEWRDVEA